MTDRKFCYKKSEDFKRFLEKATEVIPLSESVALEGFKKPEYDRVLRLMPEINKILAKNNICVAEDLRKKRIIVRYKCH